MNLKCLRLPTMSSDGPQEMGGVPANLGPSLLQLLLCCTPAKQLLTLSFPKKSQALHVTVVMDRCGARPQMAALQPTGSLKPRAPVSSIQLCLFGQSQD